MEAAGGLFFCARRLQIGGNKGVNPVGFGFGLIYTLALRERDLWGELGMFASSSRIPPRFISFLSVFPDFM